MTVDAGHFETLTPADIETSLAKYRKPADYAHPLAMTHGISQ